MHIKHSASLCTVKSDCKSDDYVFIHAISCELKSVRLGKILGEI